MWFELMVTLITVGLILFALCDADVSLMLAEMYGKTIDTLQGQVVWIIGSSSGIGEHLAVELAKAGCRLVLSARRTEELERVRLKCIEAGNLNEKNVLVLSLDILELDKHAPAMQKVIQHFGKIDILVNNAGRSQTALIENSPFENDCNIMNLNFLSVIHLTKVVLPRMVQQGRGHVVVTGSMAGIIGVPQSASYSATKFALRGWFDAMRTEYYKHNIKVTMVCPGPVKSEINKAAFGNSVNKPYGRERSAYRLLMETDRCANLMAIAIANQMSEVWISRQPYLFFTYPFQYAPTISRWFANVCGPNSLDLVKEDIRSTNQ